MNSDLLSGADDRPPTFTQLLRGLQEGPPSTRRLAAHAVWEGLFSLRKGHEVTEPVTPDEGLLRGELVTALTAALRAGRGTTEDEKALRYSVCRAIMELGPLAAGAIPALEETLVEVADGAKDAAGALGEIGEAAIPALIRTLSHPDDEVRRAAAQGLGRGGPAAVPALCNVLRGCPDMEDISYHVARALVRVGDVGILARLMKDDSVHVRRAASDALGTAGFAKTARHAIPALAEALSDEDGQVREHAARALERIGTHFESEPEKPKLALQTPDLYRSMVPG